MPGRVNPIAFHPSSDEGNQMSYRKTAFTFAAVAGLLTAGASVTAANASTTTTVTATTQVTAQPDTTSPTGSGTACDTGSTYAKTYGPVWADDDFKASLTAVPTGTDTWHVTLHVGGTFAGFADPLSCDASLSAGSLEGTIQYSGVTSADTPSQANLESSYTSFPDNLNGLVAAFFGDPSVATEDFGDGTYSFSYQGGNMTEDNSGIFGDVTGNGGAVTGLTAVVSGTSSVTLKWDATTGASGYQYTVTGGGVTSAPVTTTGTSAVVTGLTAGVTYTFAVSAEPSASGSASVTATIAPPKPSEVRVPDVTGLRLAVAEARMAAAGLKVNIIAPGGTGPKGSSHEVYAQWHLGGTEVPAGQTENLHVKVLS
jgi:PASTA domain